MINYERQYELFNKKDTHFSDKNHSQDIFIEKKIIKEWQEKIIRHQSHIFK